MSVTETETNLMEIVDAWFPSVRAKRSLLALLMRIDLRVVQSGFVTPETMPALLMLRKDCADLAERIAEQLPGPFIELVTDELFRAVQAAKIPPN